MKQPLFGCFSVGAGALFCRRSYLLVASAFRSVSAILPARYS